MAERSVFVSKNSYPFFEEIRVQFDYFQGFALSQKRKSQIGLHQNFLAAYPQEKILEISSTSLYSLGVALSAMNLKKQTKSGITTVESAFQSSRIYGTHDEIGPFHEFLFLPGKECKKLVKEKSQGLHSYHYQFDGLDFYAPNYHISLFYDYLYLNALCEEENKAVANRLLTDGYTAFTDLATISLNCQARSCALFVSLVKNDLIDQVRDFESYLRLFRTTLDGKPIGQASYENVQLLKKKDRVHLLSPLVPGRMTREDVEKWYAVHCGKLTNRKTEDNYLDLQTP